MAHWRIELGAEDLAALSRGEEVVIVATDDDADLSEETIEVTVVSREY